MWFWDVVQTDVDMFLRHKIIFFVDQRHRYCIVGRSAVCIAAQYLLGSAEYPLSKLHSCTKPAVPATRVRVG